jgi:hypothetical protein
LQTIFLSAITIASVTCVTPELGSRAQELLGGLGSLGLLRGDEQQVQSTPADLITFLIRGLFSEPSSRPRGSFNPLDLISVAQSVLGQRESNDLVDDTVQDPRVLQYDQEINRRNQLSQLGSLGRLARVFSAVLN